MYNDFLSHVFTEKVIGEHVTCPANPRVSTPIVDKERSGSIG